MIEKLTPEQEAELPRFRQRYLDTACNGGQRIDRKELQSALNDAYAELGKAPPLLFKFDSPAACMMAIKIFELGAEGKFKLGAQMSDQMRDQMRAQMYDQMSDQMWAQMRDQMWDQMRAQMSAQMSDQMWDQMYDQMWDQMYDQMRDQMRAQMWAQMSDQMRAQMYDQMSAQMWDQMRAQMSAQMWDQRIWDGNFLWGSQDLYWIGWGKFADYLGVKFTEQVSRRLDIMDRIGHQCEWWWPFDNMVICSERPEAIKWDENRRLHAENGPAIRYGDGYSLYAWHGTRLPAEWIEQRKTIDPLVILQETNVEKRTAGIQCIGYNRMFEHLNGKIIDDSGDPDIGELVEITIPGLSQPGRFLRAECPRNGRIFEGCPMVSEIDGLPINTAVSAQAWRNGLRADEYQQPPVRT